MFEGCLVSMDLESLVDSVLADSVAAAMVRSARAKSSWPDDRTAASNMVAWFSQQITVGRSQWAQVLERERIGATWAYRPVADSRISRYSARRAIEQFTEPDHS